MIDTEQLMKLHDILTITRIIDDVWLIGGAVLGYERDRSLLPNETDIDIAIKYPLLLTKVIPVLSDAGFKGLHTSRNNNGHRGQWTYKNPGFKFEFLTQFVCEVGYQYYCHYKGDEYMREMPHYATEVVELLGRKWRMPADRDVYLTHQYGDWRTPNPNWKYWRDCPSNVSIEKWKFSHETWDGRTMP